MRKMTIVAGLACVMTNPTEVLAFNHLRYAEGKTVYNVRPTEVCSYFGDLAAYSKLRRTDPATAEANFDCGVIGWNTPMIVLQALGDDYVKVMIKLKGDKVLRSYANVSWLVTDPKEPQEYCDRMEREGLPPCGRQKQSSKLESGLQPSPDYCDSLRGTFLACAAGMW